MNASVETTEELKIRLKRLLIIYSNIKFDEIKLFNLLGKEIEKIKQENQNNLEKKYMIRKIIKGFRYPRELIAKNSYPNNEVEKFTLTNWCRYRFFFK